MQDTTDPNFQKTPDPETPENGQTKSEKPSINAQVDEIIKGPLRVNKYEGFPYKYMPGFMLKINGMLQRPKRSN